MDSEIEISIRPMENWDKDFIMSTWLHAQRFGGNHYGVSKPGKPNSGIFDIVGFFGEIDKQSYYSSYGKRIASLLKRQGVTVTVASDKNEPLWTAGFAVTEGPLLHWVFVKPEFRNRKIATALLKGQDLKTVTSITKIGRSIAKRKGLIFNPFEGALHDRSENLDQAKRDRNSIRAQAQNPR